MPNFATEVLHQLGQDEAMQRLKSFLENVSRQYEDQVSHMEGNWNENVLTFALTTYGLTVQGKLTVEEDLARVEGQLPFAALAFRGKIEGSIQSELERELS